jgi:hypothetical protein
MIKRVILLTAPTKHLGFLAHVVAVEVIVVTQVHSATDDDRMRPAWPVALNSEPAFYFHPIRRTGRQSYLTVILAKQVQHAISEANGSFPNCPFLPLLFAGLQIQACPTRAMITIYPSCMMYPP